MVDIELVEHLDWRRNELLSKEQVGRLTNLLHEDYRDCKIEIVASRYRLMFLTIREIILCWKSVEWKREIEHFTSIYTGKVDGTYNSILKFAQVYYFNIKIENSNSRVNDLYYSTFVLFHELRHHYQNKYNRLQRFDVEPDCNRFAIRMLDRHHAEIMKIISEEVVI